MKKIKNKKLNILITCANRKIHIINWLRDSVKEIKIYVADSKKNPVSKYFADEFWHSPEFNNKNFLKIYKYLKDKKISFIFPTSDSELKFWSFYKNLLRKKNIFVMISDYETIELCSDKLKFYKFLKKNKITTIETSENLNAIKSKKFVVKERFSSGSKNCFLNLSKKKCKLLAKKIRKPIFQNFVDGKEVSIDCFVGKNIYVVLRYRELINGGESEKTTIFVNRKIKKIITNLLEKMNFTVSSAINELYTDNGLIEVMIMAFIFSYLASVSLRKIKFHPNNFLYIGIYSVLFFCSLFSFFVNFWFYLPIIFQLPMIYFLNKLVFRRRIHLSNQKDINNNPHI